MTADVLAWYNKQERMWALGLRRGKGGYLAELRRHHPLLPHRPGRLRRLAHP